MPPSKCQHGVVRRKCTVCGGAQICAHGCQKDGCPECGDSFPCQHGKIRRQCRECKGSAFCQHNRRRTRCIMCGGGSLCVHGKRKERCKDCGGSAYCIHEKRKDKCTECLNSSRMCEHGKVDFRCSHCKLKGGSRPMDTTCRTCQGTGRCFHCDGVGHCDALVRSRKCSVCRSIPRENPWLPADAFQLLPLGTLPALPPEGVVISGVDSEHDALVDGEVGSHTPFPNKTVRANRLLLWENSGIS